MQPPYNDASVYKLSDGAANTESRLKFIYGISRLGESCIAQLIATDTTHFSQRLLGAPVSPYLRNEDDE